MIKFYDYASPPFFRFRSNVVYEFMLSLNGKVQNISPTSGIIFKLQASYFSPDSLKRPLKMDWVILEVMCFCTISLSVIILINLVYFYLMISPFFCPIRTTLTIWVLNSDKIYDGPFRSSCYIMRINIISVSLEREWNLLSVTKV